MIFDAAVVDVVAVATAIGVLVVESGMDGPASFNCNHIKQKS